MLSPWATSASSTTAPASGVGLGAQADVTAALNALAKIASDGWLTSGEKPQAIKDWNDLNGSQADLVSKATAAGVSSSAFTTAMTALGNYLTSLTPAWNDTTTDTAITAATWNTDWANAYNERLKLVNAITAAAQSTGTGAQTGVNQINSVDYLTNQDKIQLVRDWTAELQIQSNLDTQADSLGVSRAAYDTAVSNLSANLISAGAPSNWATTWPDGTTFAAISIVTNLRTWWTSIALNRAALQKAIADKVQANAAYADALARSSYNLIKNGNSEASPIPSGPDGNWATFSSIPYVGNGCRGVDGNGTAMVAPVSESIPCGPGDQFYMEAMALRGGSAGSGAPAIIISFTGPTITETIDTIVSTSSASYTKISANAVAPAGATAVYFSLYTNGILNTGAWCLWDCLYACRKISAGMLQADAIQTTDYAESGGTVTSGTRVAITAGSGAPGIKTTAAGLQMGSTLFSDYMAQRLMQAIDGMPANGRYFYRGMVDNTTRGGAPDIAALTITQRRWDTTNKIGRLELKLQPSAPASNLDAMRYAKIALYRQSAAGTTATLTSVDTYYPSITDRLYYNQASDSDAANAVFCTFETNDAAIISGFPAALVALYNAYGGSAANCFYSGSSAGDGVALVNNGTTWPTGITGGTSGDLGGGGGGGACPAPWVRVRLASGLEVDAGDLYNGAQLIGVDENTMQPAKGTVRNFQIVWDERAAIILEDGRAPEFSLPHRLAVVGRGWVPCQEIQPGDELVGDTRSRVVEVRRTGMGQVCAFVVEGCHTYITDGVLSHNVKILIP